MAPKKKPTPSLRLIGIGNTGRYLLGLLSGFAPQWWRKIEPVLIPSIEWIRLARVKFRGEIKKRRQLKRILLIGGLGGPFGSPSLIEISNHYRRRRIPVSLFLVFPFAWEGKKRERRATETLTTLSAKCPDIELYRHDAEVGWLAKTSISMKDYLFWVVGVNGFLRWLARFEPQMDHRASR